MGEGRVRGAHASRDGMRMTAAILRERVSPFVPCLLGLAVVRIWIQAIIYGRYAATDFGSYTVLANLIRVAFIVLLLVVFSHRSMGRIVQRNLSWFSVTAMTLAPVFHLVQPIASGIPFDLFACVIGGLGLVWGAGMWIGIFVRLAPRVAFFYAFACLAASALGGLVVGFLPQDLVYVIAAFLPTLALVAYWRASALLDEGTLGGDAVPRNHAYDAEPRSTFIRLACGLALLDFALGVARGFPDGQSIALSVPFQIVHQVGVALICIAVVWRVLARGARFGFGSAWRFQIAFMVAGVLLIASLDQPFAETGAVLVTMANTLMLGLLWYCAYDFSRHSSYEPYLVLGGVWVIHLLPREVGRHLISAVGVTDGFVTVAIAIVVCLLALSMAFVLRDDVPASRPFFADLGADGRYNDSLQSAQASERPSVEGRDSAADTLEHRCAELQEVFGLTDRERDMAWYIAQGRSKGRISEELFISENTVKGYTRSLYVKIGVHSKQQLLDTLSKMEHRRAE